MLKKSLFSLACAAALGLGAGPVMANSFWLIVPIPTNKAAQPTPGEDETISVTLNPVPALQENLLKAKVGVPYSRAFSDYLTVTGDPSYTPSAVSWILKQGTLPTGLTLASNGVVSGTPTQENPGSTFELLATYKGQTGAQTYTIRVGSLTFDATQLAAGDEFTCALTPAGGVMCWGEGVGGQLGQGEKASSLAPVQVQGLESGVRSIAAGDYHACAVLNTGGAVCWGWNQYGQLGNGLTTSTSVPVPVVGLYNVTKIEPSLTYTCAIDAGAAKCWGANDYGQLGDGTTAMRLSPVTPSGVASGVTDIATGGGHTCAVVNGGAKCWGDNYYSQAGTGISSSVDSEYYVPQNVSGLASGVSRIAAGFRHTCAVTTGGGVKCWGANGDGQMGINDWGVSESEFPRDVYGLSGGATAIAAGFGHTCAVVTGGVKCWGDDSSGQLGNGITWDQGVAPVDAILAGAGVTNLSLGDRHSCAVVAGEAKCWGYNWAGQLGDRTTEDRDAPVFVQP